MEARQRAQLTGTNRSSDLIALVAKARARAKARAQRTDDGDRTTDDPPSSVLQPPSGDLRPAKASFASVGRQATDDRGRISGLWSPSPVARNPFFAGLVALARRSDPIPSRTRPSNALAPMVLCLKTWESRSSPGLQRTEPLPLHAPDPRNRRAATLAEQAHERAARKAAKPIGQAKPKPSTRGGAAR